MDLTLLDRSPLSTSTPLLAIPVPEGDAPLSGWAAEADERLGGALSAARAAGDFRGKEEDGALFYLGGGEAPERILFLGMGKVGDLTPETLRKVAGRAVRRAEGLRLTGVTLALPHLEAESGSPDAAASLEAVAEGLILAAWDFRELRSEPKADDPPPPLVTSGVLALPEGFPLKAAEVQDALRYGIAAAEGANLARTLQMRPGNVATPTHLAGVALQLADQYHFESRILGPREMAKEGMGALLSVAAGSDEEPRFIVLEHRGGKEGEAPLVLVGKGLTFDTGGVSIKPAAGMEEMKFDMSGGAAVLGAMKAVGMLGVKGNVIGVVPSSENTISGKATKPGDVIRTREGKTVEVINTDAEGRLILADALSYAKDHFEPAAMVDCATLTGAVVVGLGNQAIGLMGTDDALVEELRAAGEHSGERCWPLPLWKEYRKQLDSPVADMKNVGGRAAGTITAGIFLKEFTGEVPWAHLDIAGTAYGDTRAPYHRNGGFGLPTRLLLAWIRSRTR